MEPQEPMPELPPPPSPDALADAGISALARHYGTPEAEIMEELADRVDAGLSSPVLLENVTWSLITALNKLTEAGFDDAAYTAWEELGEVTPPA